VHVDGDQGLEVHLRLRSSAMISEAPRSYGESSCRPFSRLIRAVS